MTPTPSGLAGAGDPGSRAAPTPTGSSSALPVLLLVGALLGAGFLLYPRRRR